MRNKLLLLSAFLLIAFVGLFAKNIIIGNSVTGVNSSAKEAITNTAGSYVFEYNRLLRSGAIDTVDTGLTLPSKSGIRNIYITVQDTIESTNDSSYVEIFVGSTKIGTKYFHAKGKLPQDSLNAKAVGLGLSGNIKYAIVRKAITEGRFKVIFDILKY